MMNGQNRQNILVDTSIPLEGGEAVIAKLNKVAPVFVTDIVLQELDGHKNNSNGAVAYQAREFFRRLGKANGEALFVLPPDGMKLEKTDTLRRMTLGNTPLHVIVRKPYKSRDINDSKIIEVAKDYNMTLVTLDMAQRVRAMSEGVNVETLEVEEKKKNTISKKTYTRLFLGIFGLLCLFVGVFFTGYLVLFGVESNISMGFVFCLYLFGVIALSVAYPETNKQYSKNDDFAHHENSDILHDPTYSSVSGNVYNS